MNEKMLQKKSQVTEGRLPCPKCPSSDAYHVYDDGHGYCFSCQYFQPAEGDFLEEDLYTYEYLPHRGLTKKTLEFYDIRTKIDKNGKPIADGFTYPSNQIKVRTLDRKEFYWEKSSGEEVKPGLFGRDKFNTGGHDYVILTEGEYDAASCYQVLKVPSVSIRSSSTGVADVNVDRSFIDAHERIYLAFDNDAPGRATREAVARLFDFNKVYVLEFDQFKDANEYLKAGKEDELRNIYANAKKYLPETVLAINKSSVAKILSETASVGVPYPFPKLNSMTYGMRRGESVLITAQEGVGKTELMHALEYQLLTGTQDNVGAIFLEEPRRDHLKTLASIHLERPCFVPEQGVSDHSIAKAVEEVCGVDDRLYLYSHFGSDDPDVLLDTIRFMVTACSCNWVLLDHLTMVVSGLQGDKDVTRALDYISTRLEMMVKELNFGLIFVSHVNDEGLTRGSRMISKVCDVRVDLTRNLKEDSNIINLRVSKNRPPMGKTGNAGDYSFDTFTRKYSEVSNLGEQDDGLTNPYTQGLDHNLSQHL
jgi:twinkle protein